MRKLAVTVLLGLIGTPVFAQMPNPYGASISLENARKISALSVAEANKNVAVHLNAATCIVKCFEEAAAGKLAMDLGTSKRLNNRMQGYMNFVSLRDAGNHRLEQIRKAWDAVPH